LFHLTGSEYENAQGQQLNQETEQVLAVPGFSCSALFQQNQMIVEGQLCDCRPLVGDAAAQERRGNW